MTTTEWFALLGLLAVLLAAVVGSWTSLNKQVAALKRDVALLRSNDLDGICNELARLSNKIDGLKEKLDERPCGEHEVQLDEVGRRLAALERRGE